MNSCSLKKEDEKLIAEIYKKYEEDEKSVSTKNMLVATIVYISGLCPRLDINNPLSLKELLCLILLALGKNPEQCADLLQISSKSMPTYEKRIREKLGARNRTHALYLATKHGYLSIIS